MSNWSDCKDTQLDESPVAEREQAGAGHHKKHGNKTGLLSFVC